MGFLEGKLSSIMNFQETITENGIYLSTLIVCFISGFFPLVNTEVYLTTVSLITSKHEVFYVALISALSQMIAKSMVYFTGSGVLKLPIKRFEKGVERVVQQFKEWKHQTRLLIFVSAFSGLPPFYLVSFVAGILKIKFQEFFIFGLLGRFLRFSVTVFFPELVRELIQ